LVGFSYGHLLSSWPVFGDAESVVEVIEDFINRLPEVKKTFNPEGPEVFKVRFWIAGNKN
jgi:hypothetical protein